MIPGLISQIPMGARFIGKFHRLGDSHILRRGRNGNKQPSSNEYDYSYRSVQIAHPFPPPPRKFRSVFSSTLHSSQTVHFSINYY